MRSHQRCVEKKPPKPKKQGKVDKTVLTYSSTNSLNNKIIMIFKGTTPRVHLKAFLKKKRIEKGLVELLLLLKS